MTTAASKVTAQITADDIDECNDKVTQLLDKDAERSTPRLPATTSSAAGGVVPLSLSIKERAVALYHDPPGWFPLGLLFTNQCLFALMHVVVKPALHFIPPIALAMMRVSLALPFLFLIAWKEGSLSKIGRRDARYMLLLGLVGVALPQTLVFVANKLAGPNVVAIMSPVSFSFPSLPPSLILSSASSPSLFRTLIPPLPPSLQAAPVYAAIFASALKLERLTRVKVGGILLAVAGALVVLRPDKMDLANGHPDGTSAGICVMVLQTMCYAAFLVALKSKLQTHPYPFGLYAYASLIGVVIIAVAGFLSGSVFFDVKMPPRSAWLAVLYCGFVVSFFAHACQSWYVFVWVDGWGEGAWTDAVVTVQAGPRRLFSACGGVSFAPSVTLGHCRLMSRPKTPRTGPFRSTVSFIPPL